MTAKPNSASKKPRSASRSKAAKKPVTIELEAEKVASKTSAATKSAGARNTSSSDAKTSSQQKAEPAKSAVPKSGGSGGGSRGVGRDAAKETTAPKHSSSLFGKVAAGIIGGVIALGGGAALQYFGYLPGFNSQKADVVTQTALGQSESKLNSKIAALEEKLQAQTDTPPAFDKAAVDAAIETRLAQMPAPVPNIDAVLSEINDTMADRGDAIVEMRTKLKETNAALDVLKSNAADGAGVDTAAVSGLASNVESVTADVARLRDDIAKNTLAIGAGDLAAVAKSLSSLQSKVGDLGKQLETVSAKTAALPDNVADASALKSVTTELSSVKSAVDNVQAEISGQQEKLAGLQQRVENGADKKAAQALAAAALKNNVDQGQPFAESLSLLKTYSGDSAELAKLEPYAAGGIPSVTMLAGRFEKVSQDIIIATTEVKEDNAMSRLFAGAKSFVKVKSIGPVEGDTPAAIVSRIGAAVNSGNLETASTQWATLPQAGKAASAEWHKDLQARLAANSVVKDTVDTFLTSSSGAGN